MFLICTLASKNVLTYVSVTAIPNSCIEIPVLNIKSGDGGLLSISIVVRISSEATPTPLTNLTENLWTPSSVSLVFQGIDHSISSLPFPE